MENLTVAVSAEGIVQDWLWRLTVATRKWYYKNLMQLLEFLGIDWDEESSKLLSVSVADVERWRISLANNKLAQSTIEAKYASMRAIVGIIQTAVERKELVKFKAGASIEIEEAIPVSCVDELFDALVSAIRESEKESLTYGDIEKLDYYLETDEPDGIEPSIKEAFIRADERAQALNIAPFEYSPEFPEDQYKWPHLTIQFQKYPSPENDTRDCVLLGIEKMREIVAVYREEGVPFFTELTIYAAPTLDWGQARIQPEESSDVEAELYH